MGLTNFPNGITSFGIPVMGSLGIPFTGKYFFVDPANGSDGNTGLSPSKALSTLYKAHSLCTAGKNDVVFLIGDGSTTATARLSTAIAATVDSTATTGTLTWSKNATHLIGITAPTAHAQRARIAPPTGTYTMATFGSGNFVVVTGAGCTFANLSLFNGFSTGGASQICWTDSGGRNAYFNVHFGGMGDANSAATTTGASLLCTGSTGESTFYNCTIGLTTVPRSTGASEIKFASGNPRCKFIGCTIETNSAAGADFWIAAPSGSIDRTVEFDNCTFTNCIGSGATILTNGINEHASCGGAILLKNCLVYGATAIASNSLVYTNQANAATAGSKVAVASA